MSSHHGGQSMSHPIITLHLVWFISHSNSWSTSLVLTKVFLDMDSKFQIWDFKIQKWDLEILKTKSIVPR
jgi:hypothetical protein